jgi:hypothetical protein
MTLECLRNKNREIYSDLYKIRGAGVGQSV